ncbi:MAG: replication-associated recombination protein A [Geminicoccaceae bacterium]|nr:MAG: replication-associated recombination protein A [Geminicoccaceae bacterium]
MFAPVEGRRAEAAPRPSAAPLAERLRPRRLDEVVGQDHLFGAAGALGAMVAGGRLRSLVLWGPPGCGKTTIARLLVEAVGARLLFLSAVTAGVADLRRVFEEADRWRRAGVQAVLFIDEIHRFNRAQQDGLLARVEDGTITLIGATTENPSFALTSALLSRLEVVVLQPLDTDALGRIVDRAETLLGASLPLQPAARALLVQLADGDGRYLATLIEALLERRPAEPLNATDLQALLQQRRPRYDRGQDQHFNLISALHKAVRASDPDAALYWLARMLDAGEDARYVARRLVRMASEDVGLADPTALPAALAAAEAFERLGSPEGELALAQATLHLATAPKSNATYLAWKAASTTARAHGSLAPKAFSMNAPTALMRDLGYAEGYLYDHDAPDGCAGQDHFPEGLPREAFYRPTDRGVEAGIGERLRRFEAKRRGRGLP